MPLDPKIRLPAPGVRVTTPAPAPVKPQATPLPSPTLQPSQPAGYKTTSTFDGRAPARKRDGIPDDSIGRRSKGGIADDGIGRATKGGIADDGIGNNSYEAALDALVGRDDTAESLALRDALFSRLETPSFLKGSGTVPAQVAAYAKTMNLSKTQLGQVDTLLRGASKETASLVGALLEKAPEVLSSVDGAGQTTLANLARLASEPLNPKAAGDTTKGDLLSAVLRDIVNPNRIDQGDAPTCTVTSMQYELVADEPAEYARLMADLTGPDGRAKMRGGSYLELEVGDAGAGARDSRSVSNAIFQTAAMEFGNGRDGQFDPYAGKSVNAVAGTEQRGLKPAQQTQVLRQLFGVNYESKNFRNESDGQKVLEKLRNYDTRGAQNRPIVLQIDQGDFNHAVTFERVKDQRVYYRDPYGVLRSMPEQNFGKYVMAMNAPRDLGFI